MPIEVLAGPDAVAARAAALIAEEARRAVAERKRFVMAVSGGHTLWAAGGLYQVGSFVGNAWGEWNGKFRDDVRSFLRSDNGMVRALAYRLTGSPDVYAWEGREPEQSFNFVTCHDGFTLNDLVSYNAKGHWHAHFRRFGSAKGPAEGARIYCR